jgi:hypothetical protein
MRNSQHRHLRAAADPMTVISPRVLPPAQAELPYVFQLEAVGLLPNERAVWRVAPGYSLPDGLEISADGLISGIPTTVDVGTKDFCIEVSHVPV